MSFFDRSEKSHAKAMFLSREKKTLAKQVMTVMVFLRKKTRGCLL